MKPLKLIALDEEDLAIVSSHLQDAVVRVGDMVYQPSKKRFAAVLNRFDWELAQGGNGKDFKRRRTALRFERVFGAQLKNVKPSAQERVLSLLAVRFEPDERSGRQGHPHLFRRRLDPTQGRVHRGRAQGPRPRLEHAFEA